MDDKVEHDTAELEPNEQDECVSNKLSEETSVYMKENEINCDSKHIDIY
uniref:Uncharacterized protein n=1 Tax=Heterorhabditis bacteriophora TaxID=37862 RepID=A0A1I7W9R0_HETBA